MSVNLVEILLSLAFPAVCEICGAPAPGVCAGCESNITLIPGPHCVSCGRTLKTRAERCAECHGQSFHFDRAFACAPYEGAMKELLHAYKFSGRKCLKNFFIKIMKRFLTGPGIELDFNAVAAVPLNAPQRRARGFNQSELLSGGVAAHAGVPDLSRFLTRRHSSHPQHLLTKSRREQNVKGCFAVKDTRAFQGKKVLLVDDILTTGQTASECARTLKAGGALSVQVLACARGL